MRHQGTAEIKTERLTLRPFNPDDLESMYRNFESDSVMTEFLRWEAAKDIAQAKNVLDNWIESYKNLDFYQWAIVLNDIDEPIGTISVIDKNEKLDIISIGYCIGSKWWHRGYTSEAFKAIIPFFFEEVGVNRIEAQHDPDNVNSGLVMKKCGLKYEGTLRQSDWSNRGIVDKSVYSILRAEWGNLC